jgi:hypothetical protein
VTDEARIARLTELARRVWPQFENLRVVATPIEALVLFDYGSEKRRDTSTLLHVPHPRALDALEAALLVLSEERPVRLQTVITPLPKGRGF